VSTPHVHLDHGRCVETVVLRGAASRVRAFTDAVIARPGVRHGHLSVV
jgi:CopG family nickel-responsive transcriptional regulator